MTTAKKTLFGTIWNVLLNIFNQASSLIVYVLLARILSVEEFGLMAYCFLITEMVILFSNFGVNQILIQKPNWSERLASNCFWFLLIISVLLGLILSGIIAPLSEFYFYEGSGVMLVALATVPILNSISLVSLAKLQRHFQNRVITIINVVCTTIGGGISILLVFQGYGVWSVIVGRILQTLFTTILFLSVERYIPKYPLRKKYFYLIFKFGLPLFYNTCLTFVSTRSINLATAFLLGSAQFAFVSVAQRALRMLSEITLTPLNAVLLPAFSRVDKNTKLSDVYCRVVTIASTLVLPMYLGLGAVSEEAVFLLFGEQWGSSADLLLIFCFGSVVSVLGWFLPTLLISKGHTSQSFKINVIATVFNIIFTIVGAYFSAKMAVLGLLLAAVTSLPIRFSLTNKTIPISLFEVFKASLPALISSLVMFCAIIWGFDLLHLELAILPLLLAKIGFGFAVYTFIMLVVFKKQSYQVIGQIVPLLKKKVAK
ncbi:oligosaccharide flippase family protein [Paraglaciecola sp.]|uniref:oligosaccharide flippase family protein n=1 Tax=Paraglaciecola sp. TaxID=1920173 RepID=UPI00273F73F4|nr:oligosaccharide flippase family protein [Paraglaciecola sp.]MDP5029947.1 oligosaccharide flippase family protein [Paraglaciecola sp.]